MTWHATSLDLHVLGAICLLLSLVLHILRDLREDAAKRDLRQFHDDVVRIWRAETELKREDLELRKEQQRLALE